MSPESSLTDKLHKIYGQNTRKTITPKQAKDYIDSKGSIAVLSEENGINDHRIVDLLVDPNSDTDRLGIFQKQLGHFVDRYGMEVLEVIDVNCVVPSGHILEKELRRKLNGRKNGNSKS